MTTFERGFVRSSFDEKQTYGVWKSPLDEKCTICVQKSSLGAWAGACWPAARRRAHLPSVMR